MTQAADMNHHMKLEFAKMTVRTKGIDKHEAQREGK